MIYFNVFATTLLLSFIGLFRNVPTKEIFTSLCVFITLLVGLRYASVDYFSYLQIYNDINDTSKLGAFVYKLDNGRPIETGFVLLVLIEKLLFGHYFLFIAAFSALSLTIKFAAFKKLSPYTLISLLLYLSDEYFWKDLGQMRNAMASGIILWAFYHAYFGRLWLFVTLVGVAALFHSAAVVALPFYFVKWLRATHTLSVAVILSIAIVIAYGGLGALIIDLASFFGVSENARIVRYAGSKYVSGARAFGGTFNLQLFLCLLFILSYRKLIQKWNYNEILIPIYIYASCLFFIFIDYGIISGRIREMLAVPVACVAIPSFLLLFRGYSRIVPYMLIMLYCCVWFYMMARDQTPYQSILQFLF